MKSKYLILTILAAIGWGFSGTCGEHLFKIYQTNGEWLTTVRLLTAGSLLLLINLVTGRKDALIGLITSKRDLPMLLLFAVLGMMAVPEKPQPIAARMVKMRYFDFIRRSFGEN